MHDPLRTTSKLDSGGNQEIAGGCRLVPLDEVKRRREARNAEKQIMFAERYGHGSLVQFFEDNLRDIMQQIREVEYEMRVLNHPFGADLAACAETNS